MENEHQKKRIRPPKKTRGNNCRKLADSCVAVKFLQIFLDFSGVVRLYFSAFFFYKFCPRPPIGSLPGRRGRKCRHTLNQGGVN